MKQLYELSKEMLELQTDLEQAQEIENPTEQEERIEATIKRAIERLDSNLSEEADNLGALIKILKTSANTRKEEARRMRELGATDENYAKKISTALWEALEGLGHKRIKTPRFAMTVAGNGGKAPLRWIIVNVPNGSDEFDLSDLRQESIDALPEEFLKPVVRQVDTDAIREALQAGRPVQIVTEDKEEIKIFEGERGKHLLLR